ncbi:hypothetical protein BDF19DRAFT_78199 [Syncephalis fuscata]|nr:hypothetical protein BDF19DRAFT_78199 [Syncephalis fuscata]
MTTHGLVETVENTLKTIIEEITSQLDNNLTTTVTIASSTFTTSTIEWTNTESRLFHSIAYQLQSELTATDNSSTVAILKRLQFDAECLLDRRKFALHAVPYQTVSTDSLRRFSSCALLRGTIELVIAYRYIKYLWASNLEIKRDEIKYHLEKSIEILDTGLIMAGALGTEQCVHSLIDAANQLLVSISIDCNIDRTENTKRRRLVSDTVTEDSSWLVALQTLLDRQHTATTTIPALSTELRKVVTVKGS